MGINDYIGFAKLPFRAHTRFFRIKKSLYDKVIQVKNLFSGILNSVKLFNTAFANVIALKAYAFCKGIAKYAGRLIFFKNNLIVFHINFKAVNIVFNL